MYIQYSNIIIIWGSHPQSPKSANPTVIERGLPRTIAGASGGQMSTALSKDLSYWCTLPGGYSSNSVNEHISLTLCCLGKIRLDTVHISDHCQRYLCTVRRTRAIIVQSLTATGDKILQDWYIRIARRQRLAFMGLCLNGILPRSTPCLHNKSKGSRTGTLTTSTIIERTSSPTTSMKMIVIRVRTPTTIPPRVTKFHCSLEDCDQMIISMYFHAQSNFIYLWDVSCVQCKTQHTAMPFPPIWDRSTSKKPCYSLTLQCWSTILSICPPRWPLLWHSYYFFTTSHGPGMARCLVVRDAGLS